MENWYKIALSSDDELIQELDKSLWVNVNSIFIDAIAYHELAHVLEVKLNTGKIYTFMNVPPSIYGAFLAAPSKGNFFNAVIKQNYTKS